MTLTIDELAAIVRMIEAGKSNPGNAARFAAEIKGETREENEKKAEETKDGKAREEEPSQGEAKPEKTPEQLYGEFRADVIKALKKAGLGGKDIEPFLKAKGVSSIKGIKPEDRKALLEFIKEKAKGGDDGSAQA